MKTKKQVCHTSVVGAEVRHGYMPVGRQEALIVPPCGIQVGPGAVSGIITPRSLVQHGDGKDEEEEEVERTQEKVERGQERGSGNIRWERKVGWGGGNAKEEESGEACGRKEGETAEDEKEAYGEIYEEDNVRSAPLKFRMKKQGVCEDQAGREENV